MTEHVKDVELSNIQKIFVACSIAFLLWMGGTVYSMSVSLAVLTVQVESLVSNAGDRYTSTQAAADKLTINSRMITIEEDINRLEKKHGL